MKSLWRIVPKTSGDYGRPLIERGIMIPQTKAMLFHESGCGLAHFCFTRGIVPWR